MARNGRRRRNGRFMDVGKMKASLCEDWKFKGDEGVGLIRRGEN